MENWKILDTVAVDKNYDMKGIISGQIVDHQSKMPLSSFEQTKYWFMCRGKLFFTLFYFLLKSTPFPRKNNQIAPLKRDCVHYQLATKELDLLNKKLSFESYFFLFLRLPFLSVFTTRVGRGVVGPVELTLGVVMFIPEKEKGKKIGF